MAKSDMKKIPQYRVKVDTIKERVSKLLSVTL
jgi:hypothetical protein